VDSHRSVGFCGTKLLGTSLDLIYFSEQVNGCLCGFFFSALFFGYSLRVAYAKKMDFEETERSKKKQTNAIQYEWVLLEQQKQVLVL